MNNMRWLLLSSAKHERAMLREPLRGVWPNEVKHARQFPSAAAAVVGHPNMCNVCTLRDAQLHARNALNTFHLSHAKRTYRRPAGALMVANCKSLI